MLNGGIFRSFQMESEGLGCPASTEGLMKPQPGLPAFWCLQRAQITLGLVGAAVVEELEEGTCHTDFPPSQRRRTMDTSHLYEVGLARPGTGGGGQQVDLFLLRAVTTYGSVEGHGLDCRVPGN